MFGCLGNKWKRKYPYGFCKKCNSTKPLNNYYFCSECSYENQKYNCKICSDTKYIFCNDNYIRCMDCKPIKKLPSKIFREEYCVICLEKNATLNGSKCGHISLCLDCYFLTSECPICRIKFNK